MNNFFFFFNFSLKENIHITEKRILETTIFLFIMQKKNPIHDKDYFRSYTKSYIMIENKKKAKQSF